MRHITVTSSCNRCLENTIFQGHGGFLGNSPSHSLFMHCKKKKNFVRGKRETKAASIGRLVN